MRLAALLWTLFLTAGCSDQARPQPVAETDRDTINLVPMQFDEYSRVVPPSLSCAFKMRDEILLVASAPDERTARAAAVIKADGELVPLTGSSDGGYLGMRESANNFQGRGYDVVVEHAGGEGRRSGVETTVWPARLTVQNSEGRNQMTGDWSCGA